MRDRGKVRIADGGRVVARSGHLSFPVAGVDRDMQPIIRGSMLPSMTPTCSRRKLSRLAIRCLREFQIGNRVTARKSTGISFVLSIGEMTLLLKEGDCERSHQRRDHSLMGVHL